MNLRREPVFPVFWRSDRWKSPDLAISMRKVWQSQSHSLVVEGVELSGIDVVLRTSVAARLQKTNSEIVWLKQLLMWVSFTCSSSLSFTAMTKKTGAWSDLCQSHACIDISLCSGHVFVYYSSTIIPTVLSDLLHLLHHWFEGPPFCGRGSLVRDVWIYGN